MKNLSKKIGVGVVASSLVVGGAVSTGLVANADSVTESQVQQTNKDVSLDEISDSTLVKLAKDKLGFKVFGYYFIDSSTNKRRMDQDIHDVAVCVTKKDTKKYEENEKLVEEKLLNKNLLDGEFLQKTPEEELNKELDINANNGKEFIEHINKYGIDKGVKKVRVGDAIVILVLENEVKPNKNWYTNEDLKKLKGSYVDVQDIEERDYLHSEVLDAVSNFVIEQSQAYNK